MPVGRLALSDSAIVTEIGGPAIISPEPAALDLTIDPSTPLSLDAGPSTAVTTTEQNTVPAPPGPGPSSGPSSG